MLIYVFHGNTSQRVSNNEEEKKKREGKNGTKLPGRDKERDEWNDLQILFFNLFFSDTSFKGEAGKKKKKEGGTKGMGNIPMRGGKRDKRGNFNHAFPREKKGGKEKVTFQRGGLTAERERRLLFWLIYYPIETIRPPPKGGRGRERRQGQCHQVRGREGEATRRNAGW